MSFAPTDQLSTFDRNRDLQPEPSTNDWHWRMRNQVSAVVLDLEATKLFDLATEKTDAISRPTAVSASRGARIANLNAHNPSQREMMLRCISDVPE